ncbi:CBS domain-containing protein [Streptomyces sp. MMBL 11-3]|uniref:CBS domain-containing protein n=1 Tax=Streptomyces sp. MMBL 11-3 TaxID=3382639 RepID=UPI0039B59B40
MHGNPHLVSDVMTRTVVTVGREATFKEIVRILEEHEVSALPVLDGAGQIVGVVSEADLLPKEEFRDDDPDRRTQMRRLADLAKAGAVTAQDLMSAPALTIHDGATLAQAARTMARHGVKRLPVVDGAGALCGVVSRSDLLKVFLRPDEELAVEIRQHVVPLLAPPPATADAVRVEVRDGVVTLTGQLDDESLVPVAARLVRAVEGVIDVRCHLGGATGAPDGPS